MRKLFIPFFSAGYPSNDSIHQYLDLFHDLKADYIEIGLPHSDALADGPIIQASSQYALDHDMNIEYLLTILAQYQSSHARHILFSYYNPLFTYGLEKVCQKLYKLKAYGLLVPDLPWEESYTLRQYCQEYELQLIPLLSPTSTRDRIDQVLQEGTSFIYLVSIAGTTGGQDRGIDKELVDIIRYIREQSPSRQIVIGFGIDSPQKALDAIELGIDGVVVGSAIVRLAQNADYIQSTRQLSQSIINIL